jgi:hypothetical protein
MFILVLEVSVGPEFFSPGVYHKRVNKHMIPDRFR